MKDFKIQQAILKHIHKEGIVEYYPAVSQQLKMVNEDGELVTRQGEEGFWIVFNKNLYRLDESDLYINLDRIELLRNKQKIEQIEDALNTFNNNLIILDEPKICIKSEDISYTMFSYGKDKYFVKEKDLKVLENNYKDYEYKLYKIEDEAYILAISIRRELVGIFINNNVEEVELIGGKYEDK